MQVCIEVELNRDKAEAFVVKYGLVLEDKLDEKTDEELAYFITRHFLSINNIIYNSGVKPV